MYPAEDTWIFEVFATEAILVPLEYTLKTEEILVTTIWYQTLAAQTIVGWVIKEFWIYTSKVLVLAWGLISIPAVYRPISIKVLFT